MHILKSDSAHSVFHTQGEWEGMMKAISAPFEKADPGDVRWEPEYVQEVDPDADPQEPDEPVQAESGVPVADVLRLMQGFTDALKNLQINVAAPTVNVSPEVRIPPVTKTTIIERDQQGKMTAARTEERPVQ